jgi:hypothetical protein
VTATLAAQNTGEAAVFWICGVLAVLGALGMLFSRKPCTAPCSWR